MTPEQLQTLRNHIDASPDLTNQPAGPDGAFAIAALLNLPADPAFTAWKTSVTEDEIFANGMDWTRVDNLSAGKARIWEWMFKFGSANPSKATVRAGIAAVWVGTAADLAVRATVLGHCKRAVTRAEKLFATGTGTSNDPGTMGYEGAVSHQDVEQARELPAQ